MPKITNLYIAQNPRFGQFIYKLTAPFFKQVFAIQNFYQANSHYHQAKARAFRQKLGQGEAVFLAGIGPSGHNTGVALLRASVQEGIDLISNDEEERFTGRKHEAAFPTHTVEVLKQRLAQQGLTPGDIHVWLGSWDYADFVAHGGRWVAEHFPQSLALLSPKVARNFNSIHGLKAARVPKRLGLQLGDGHAIPITGLRHHDNHAYMAFAISPFNQSIDPVMVTVLDAHGDDGSISLYLGQRGRLQCVYNNHSLFDSLGMFYSIISSTQGGWTTLSSEGRYMGASAWGDNNRHTNPYYAQLRHLFHLGKNGTIQLNRRLANWHKWGEIRPYTPELSRILGKPIPPQHMWNPDAVLNLDDIHNQPLTQARVDKAAATQLLFEDVLFHIIAHLIRTTGSHHLILSGGTALNCVANMRLLEHFNPDYYEQTTGKARQLQLWVPPTPGDAGAVLGAAYHFALKHGAPTKQSLQHAFYCGLPTPTSAIENTLQNTADIGYRPLGNMRDTSQIHRVADLMAAIIAQDGILGLFQGPAETGPRALGHRSILANPCNPHTLKYINARVKFREPFRPLAPMLTLATAQQLFELAVGASADNYNAYNYMVLTVRAKPQAKARIPAVIHQDGTARIQIVRPHIDPITHAFLVAMGRHVGVEAAVNTSLNVGSPIVQTPEQALHTLKRAKGLTGLVLIGADGQAFIAWHNVQTQYKDCGQQLLGWYEQWQQH